MSDKVYEIFNMSDKVYNILKYIAMIGLPAIGSFYFVLSGIWGLPYGEQIVGTITAIDTLLGALLKISTEAYNKKIAETENSQVK